MIRRSLSPAPARGAATAEGPPAPPDAVYGRVHSWELSTGADGPGTRFALCTSGCPLRCRYCPKPETWYMSDGRRVTVDEVVAEVAKCRAFLAASGGGVTLGGGEPLLQPAFAGEVLRRCKELGLHTALDTSGCLGYRADDSVLAATDLVLLHVKSFDPVVHQRLTGGELAPTLHFARRLEALGKPVWVRYVLVPGWTDNDEHVDGLAAFLAGLRVVERVDVLPFRKPDDVKYQALGLPFPLADTPRPSAELTESVRGRFRSRGLHAD